MLRCLTAYFKCPTDTVCFEQGGCCHVRHHLTSLCMACAKREAKVLHISGKEWQGHHPSYVANPPATLKFLIRFRRGSTEHSHGFWWILVQAFYSVVWRSRALGTPCFLDLSIIKEGYSTQRARLWFRKHHRWFLSQLSSLTIPMEASMGKFLWHQGTEQRFRVAGPVALGKCSK